MLDLPTFRTSRLWWPHQLLDESMPGGRTRPELWLKPGDDGITLIHADDDDDKTVVAKIEPGAVAEFIWHESRGTVEITIMPDGTWRLDDPRDALTIDMFGRGEVDLPTQPTGLPPSGRIAAANWFAWDEDYETVMDTMDGFASAFAEMAAPMDTDGQCTTVDMGYWSDGVKFRVSADGKVLEAIDG
ncbi:hypothetical protein NKH45_10750 [Mesorhizobium sp. M1156]|uniref:hypothetical protein n=1 Tax=Mesorhizobium sp. M1156 TaxID=2957064 RepID=UPI0033391B22